MKRYIDPGDRIGNIVILKTWYESEEKFARCQCDCGKVYDRPTMNLRRSRGKTPVNCGCLFKTLNREKIAEAREKRDMKKLAESGRTLRKRSVAELTPWEIAERCAEIHEEAGRQLPERLTAMLIEFRKGNYCFSSTEASSHIT
jgi:hypothetical protein